MQGLDLPEDEEGRAERSAAPLPVDNRQLQACDAKDAAEFAAFYRRFLPVLVGFLIVHGAAGHLTADLAQDTMIKAWRRWPEITHPEAWARRTASRELIRHATGDRETPTEPVVHSALLRNDQAMADAFDRAWSQAVPFEIDAPHRVAPAIVPSVRLRIKRLMIEAFDGDAIARRVGLKRRAYDSHVAAIKAEYGAKNLVQPGYLLASRTAESPADR